MCSSPGFLMVEPVEELGFPKRIRFVPGAEPFNPVVFAEVYVARWVGERLREVPQDGVQVDPGG